ncbi:carboxyl transferase domain-containing protein [Altererythrobacter sp.]|uniref:carboxyl transferase domain-containing protein n=1 Tax=Altererythrobacter sp. TaxID=1872480 RepID=UPI003CFE978E
MRGILIANRGEIAIRIARAARKLSVKSVAVHAIDDSDSLHLRIADEVAALPGSGTAAYLDQDAIIEAARSCGCDAIHPGYGFLSENAEFARLCAKNGIRFIGPAPEMLDLFGDKAQARSLAQELGVPIMPGTEQATSLEEAQDFAKAHGAVMLKALAGGGGRGMRAVTNLQDLADSYARCQSEAMKAFGIGDLYVEKLLTSARHIEVQVVGDGSGAICHLWERDCTVQRRHQKVVEIAPSPVLEPSLRDRIIAAATEMAAHVQYESLGTFEFLVGGDEFWFMEANPRLQVEHTITEEVTGVDLVTTQIAIADGATLAEVGLAETPKLRGFAIQARVNLEAIESDGSVVPQSGTITAMHTPSGPGIRFDHCAYAGYKTSLRYDSLLGKVIAHAENFVSASSLLSQALRELRVNGVTTNVPLLRNILVHPDFIAGGYDTRFIGDNLPRLLEPLGDELALDLPESADSPGTGSPNGPDIADGAGDAVSAPMSGIVVSLSVEVGSVVSAGETLAVLEAMKMEHVVRAEQAGRVTVLAVTEGSSIEKGQGMLRIDPSDGDDARAENGGRASASGAEQAADPGWQAEVDEIAQRRALAHALGGSDKVDRQKASGKMHARERIDHLLDSGSFSEIGALTGFGVYDENGDLIDFTPANFVAGVGAIDGRTVMVGADDFTIRAGSGDAAIHDKQIFAERHACEMRMPVIRLLDGASGGGSVKIAQEKGYNYLPVNPGWDAVVDLLSVTPVVAAALGPTVGLGAARLAMSHLAILVDPIGQVFTAGPPIVHGATGEQVDKHELGGAEVHRESGVVERIVASEEDAFALIHRFLSYLPSSVYELPPVIACDDPADRREDALLSAVPRNERRAYELEPILEAIFDRGSIFPYAEYGGGTYTALARLDGHPVGVIATDPQTGPTMSVEGAQAMVRLVDLCETFHLPIVSLTDQGGVSIGRAAELRGSIRHGVRAIAAVYQAQVPQAEIILRRVFGVGGAGMIDRHRASRSWAWPSGSWGSLPAKGGIEAAFRRQLDEAEDREAEIARIRRELEHIASPFRTAEKFGIQDIIDPRESRPLLCAWVRDAYRVLPQQIGRPSFGMRP